MMPDMLVVSNYGFWLYSSYTSDCILITGSTNIFLVKITELVLRIFKESRIMRESSKINLHANFERVMRAFCAKISSFTHEICENCQA